MDNHSRKDRKQSKIKSMDWQDCHDLSTQEKKKVSQQSSLSFQFCPDTGPNEVVDSFDSGSQQPSFGVQDAMRKLVKKLQTPQTKIVHNQFLFNTDPANFVVLKTEESISFSDTPKNQRPLEKEIYTEDSSSIKIHKFEDSKNHEGDFSESVVKSRKILGQNQQYKFTDLNSALPKIYNKVPEKKVCENMESFGVIRSFSQNSQVYQSPKQHAEEQNVAKVESSNDTLSRDMDKFQNYENDDPTQGTQFQSQLQQNQDYKYISIINIDKLKEVTKPESPQILADIQRVKKQVDITETPGFPRHRIHSKKDVTPEKKRSRNIIQGSISRKFFNSMDKIDRLLISQNQEESKEFVLKTQNCGQLSQSFKLIKMDLQNNKSKSVPLQWGPLSKKSSKEEQMAMLASKNSMSELVSDQIDKLGTYLTTQQRGNGCTLIPFKELMDLNNQSFEKMAETPTIGIGQPSLNMFSDLMNNSLVHPQLRERINSTGLNREESKGNFDSQNQTTIYENQNHTGNTDSESYTFSGEENEQPRMLVRMVQPQPAQPEVGDRGSSLSKNSLSSTLLNNPQITERLARTQIPQNQQDEVNSEKIQMAKKNSLYKGKRNQENSDSNLSSLSPQTVSPSYRQLEAIQYSHPLQMDSLSQFADKRIKRRQTRINIVRGNDDDDKQSIKRFPKRKVERHLTQKDEKIRDISLDPENSTTILNLVPMNTDQPKINIQLQNCSKDFLEGSLKISSSPEYQSPELQTLTEKKLQPTIQLVLQQKMTSKTSPKLVKAPSFGSEEDLEIRIPDSTNLQDPRAKKMMFQSSQINFNMISADSTPEKYQQSNSLKFRRGNHSSKLLDIKKMKNESPDSAWSTHKRLIKRNTKILADATASPMDNIGSPVALRSRFLPRKKESLKKEKSNPSRQASMKKNKSPTISHNELLCTIGELQKRDSNILESSLVEDSNMGNLSSSKSKRGSGKGLDFSRYFSSSYFKGKKMKELVESPLKVSQYRQMTQDMFLQINKIKELMQTEYHDLPEDSIIHFKFKKKGYKKLLIFDLDETLIHIWRDQSELEEGFIPEVEIPIYDPATGEIELYGLSVRPFVQECLQFANKYFEVAIFTASYEWFASQIIDYLDPDGSLVQHRFYRQHTSQLEDLIVKDLNIFQGEVSLEDILIVDNKYYSFAFQLENGIPILDFMGDQHDSELLKLMKYLQHLNNFQDLREENEKNFKLKEMFNHNMENYIQYYDSDEWSEEEDKDFDDDGITEHLTGQKLDQQSYNLLPGADPFGDEFSTEEKRLKDNQLSLSECSSANFEMPHIKLLNSPKSLSPSCLISSPPHLKTKFMTNDLDLFLQRKNQLSRNMFDFNKNQSNDTKIIKLNLIGEKTHEAEVSIEDLSSSEVDVGGIDSMSKRLSRIYLNFSKQDGSSPKSSIQAKEAQTLSLSRKDSPRISATRNDEDFASIAEKKVESGSSGGTYEQASKGITIQRISEVEEEEKVPDFRYEQLNEEQVPSELQQTEFNEPEINMDLDSILQNSECKSRKKVRRSGTEEDSIQKVQEIYNQTEEDKIVPKTPQRSSIISPNKSLVDETLQKQQTSVQKPQKQQKPRILGRKLSNRGVIKFQASKRNKSIASSVCKSTIIPPCWDIRKQVVSRRLNPVLKSQSQVSAKYIDVKLDKLNAEMDKYWQSGAMRNGLLKNNPSIDQKYIIEPPKKNPHILIQEDGKVVEKTVKKPPRGNLSLTGVPLVVKRLTTPKHERNFTFHIGNNLKKDTLRLDEQNLSEIRKFYEQYSMSLETETIGRTNSGQGTTESMPLRGPEEFLTPNKQKRPFDNYKNWSQNKQK